MVWQIANDFDLDRGQMSLFLRFPFLEFQSMNSLQGQSSLDQIYNNTVQYVKDQKSPRFIKTHLPLSMLPSKLLETCKVFFVARNPKDVCVSWYHHNLISSNIKYKGDFQTFAKLFKEGKVLYGNYWYHLKVIKLNIILYSKYMVKISSTRI